MIRGIRGGIWCINFIDGICQLEQIESNYLLMGIDSVQKVIGKSNAYITFKNGDSWRVISVNNNSGRGQRFNISYIQYGINEDTINNFIKPATLAQPFNAINYFHPFDRFD